MHLFAALHAPGNLPLLRECAESFSPAIEEIPPDAVLFDLTGLEKLFGTPQVIAARLAAQTGVPAGIAIASNPDAALFAARGFAAITVIPRGQEAAVLAPLSVNLLQAPPEIAETFDQWGIRKLGELAALPPLGVTARLGQEGTRLWRLARGEWDRLLNPALDVPRFFEEFELEDSVDLLEPLYFLLSRMLHAVCDRLRGASLAASAIALRLTLQDQTLHTSTLRLPCPVDSPLALLKLLQLDLQEHPPAAPVVHVFLEAEPARPRVQQHGLFQPLAPEPEKIELTIARIAAFVGQGNAGSPQLIDTHRPDAFRMVPFGSAAAEPSEAVPTEAVPTESTPPAAEPSAAMRRFRPPRPAQVRMHQGAPQHVQSLSLHGAVTRSSGPWRTSGDWWTPDPWDREEWDVALSTGPLLRIFFDHRSRRWFVDGYYD